MAVFDIIKNSQWEFTVTLLRFNKTLRDTLSGPCPFVTRLALSNHEWGWQSAGNTYQEALDSYFEHGAMLFILILCLQLFFGSAIFN